MHTSGKFSEIVKVHPLGFMATNARRYATVPSLPCANYMGDYFHAAGIALHRDIEIIYKTLSRYAIPLAGELTFKNHFVEFSDDNLSFFARRFPTRSYSILFISRERVHGNLDTNPIILITLRGF